MKNILRIYKRDLKNIITNPVALIIILGLCFLPALYAWPNILACWDPYGNTKGISVAVVNKDEGATLMGRDVNFGYEIVEELRKNKDIGWTFVDEKEAEYGLTHNKYYAYIKIPEKFSKKISTLTSDNPIKPELIYKVNEKTNAISPKITDAGAGELIKKITEKFVDTANKIIFETLNEVGLTLESNKGNLMTMRDAILSINDNMGKIKSAVDKAHQGTIDANVFLIGLEKNIPILENSLDKLEKVTDISQKLVNTTQTNLNTAFNTIKIKLNEIKIINQDIQSLLIQLEDIHDNNEESIEKVIKITDKINNKLEFVKKEVTSISEFLEIIQQDSNNYIINKLINDLKVVEAKIDKQQEKIISIQTAIKNGQEVSEEVLNFLITTSKEIDNIIDKKINSFEIDIRPAINDIANNILGITENVDILTKNAKELLPRLRELVELGKSGSQKGIDITGHLQEELPKIKKELNKTSNKVEKFTEKDLNEIVNLLKNDPETLADYFANPVFLKEDRIFHIPNYGSAMSPFYTILSLWVGALLLTSILTIEVKSLNNIKLRENEKYLGRFLTFLTITIVQALIVSLGDKYILGTYIVNLKLFIGFCVLSSIVFTIINYTLASVFGNMGKAIAIVLLVLQVAGSGGTFPIQITPVFFQKLQPLLPFTYAIGATREAVGGPVWSNVVTDFKALLVFAIVFLIIGLALKKPLSNIVEKLNNKFKESGLAE